MAKRDIPRKAAKARSEARIQSEMKLAFLEGPLARPPVKAVSASGGGR